MTRTIRNIIRIDEEKCNGCGACIPGCKEGALVIEGGKAKLVSEVYCDGLGACLGTCPQGAITIEQREAEAFDQEAVEEQLKRDVGTRDSELGTRESNKNNLLCGCPGTMARSMAPCTPRHAPGGDAVSQLAHWPVQLALIPANAPYLKDAELVLLADCTAVAYANLHRDFISGKVVAMACPKLDDAEAHMEKLARVIAEGGPRSVEVVMMEVPCCSGLYAIAQHAMQRAGKEVVIKKTIVSVEGKIY